MKITNASAWLGAILLGALIPALIVACMFQEIRILPLAFAVTLGHAVFLGLLVALILRAKRKMQFIPVLAGGFHVPKLAPAGCGLLLYKSYSVATETILYKADAG